MRRNSKLAIYLSYGKKGSGKSLLTAKEAIKLLKSAVKTHKLYPKLPKRIVITNSPIAEKYEIKYKGYLYYWEDFNQLENCPRENCWKGPKKHPVHDADIQHDEIGKDLPAGGFAETPKWVKQVFSHLRKRGNRYFANTQCYEDIDISFRRQVDFAYRIRKAFGSRDKTATLPPVKFPWGIIVKQEFDPELLEWERDPEKRAIKAGFSWPELTWIGRKNIEAYDTAKELPPYISNKLEHIEKICDECGKRHVTHKAK